MQEPEFLEKAAQLAGVVRSELLAVAHRQLEGRALQMTQQDFEIVGIDVGVLGRTVEEILGMLDDVLIERRAGGHQHRQRRRLPPPGAARALPGGRDRSRDIRPSPRRRAIRYRCPARARWSPRPRGSRRRAACARSRAARGADSRRDSRARSRREWPPLAGVLQIREQNFGGQAVVGEHQRLLAALEELARDAPRLVQIAAPDAELPIHHRRIVEHEVFFAGRRAVAIHQLERRSR